MPAARAARSSATSSANSDSRWATRRVRSSAAVPCRPPRLDCGRFPVKRVAGQPVRITADIFKVQFSFKYNFSRKFGGPQP